MYESIIVGLVIGGGVALITNYISHQSRLKEMRAQSGQEQHRIEALWAEEERRREFDRKRDLFEKELGALKDSVVALVDTVAKVEMSNWTRGAWRPLSDSMAEAYQTMNKARILPVPRTKLGLATSYFDFMDTYQEWFNLADWTKPNPFQGRSGEALELRKEVQSRASTVCAQIDQLLDETSGTRPDGHDA